MGRENGLNCAVDPGEMLSKFIDEVAEERYRTYIRTRKSIALQRSLKRSYIEGLHLEPIVEYITWQNWGIPLHIKEPIYHEEVLQFYANLRSANNKDFVSRVNHVELDLDKYIINDIFNCQVRVEEDHETADDFFSYDKWPTKKHGFDLEDL
ncbi:hypothetical protein ACH5RR_026520 [Cinchona calisaya]|uniref:Uncharacterized protein n=1 Tax=Cinchona calisaya TaxID=153742 RepID=A0ABD2Z3W8_9GENT